MAKREIIIPKGMESLVDKFHYAPAVKVDNTLYISGQLGRDENLQVIEGAEAQYIQAFENLKAVLAAAGATLENVVDMITYHTDLRDIMRFMEVKNRYFTKISLPGRPLAYPPWPCRGCWWRSRPQRFCSMTGSPAQRRAEVKATGCSLKRSLREHPAGTVSKLSVAMPRESIVPQ